MAVRVLIVDDSGFFRKRLTEIISSDPRLLVVGTASNGKQAIEQAKKLKPDVITMDIEMPEMDGITATKHIMSEQPTAILMLSTWSTAGAKTTLDALEAGAVDYMPKQFEDISSDRAIAQQRLCQRLRHLAINFRKPHAAQANTETVVLNNKIISTQNTATTNPIKLVAIGTSTGGPVALQKVLSQLPANFPHPILIIQHMPAAFTPSFAERLNTQCAINIKQADDGDVLTPGTAYLAPGGKQMLISNSKNRPQIKLQDSQPDQTYHPSIDITLNSVAQIFPADTLAIILTGMGSDGKQGCQTLKQLGATIWSQDEQSSTIYGMPMAIAKARLADRILSLTDIGQQLAEIK
ncbi:MAG: chemotaxis response regulator protein-glutamate methylesterase [Piscirickettsiaceae bacterium]|nr:chemotaxis response regulator protein-glutamate methylesterase [Piscirickettsiaceae bacterium]